MAEERVDYKKKIELVCFLWRFGFCFFIDLIVLGCWF